ncbi:hypothetical protein I79_000247 [Cricetulus griseus]|uniref:Uncharacterized protein n=1 Tax=Cricetulus griseus TaxID=10029 RepID=G3GRV3_CRIGR|nr:hypothetical protein I79_000247 [Cricetulus griseus]
MTCGIQLRRASPSTISAVQTAEVCAVSGSRQLLLKELMWCGISVKLARITSRKGACTTWKHGQMFVGGAHSQSL